jgi:hypothetical protein
MEQNLYFAIWTKDIHQIPETVEKMHELEL